MPSSQTAEMVAFVQAALTARADPVKAAAMAAYMRTDVPFYGVQRKPRDEIEREMRRAFPIRSNAEYRAAIEALWNLPHREEKYLALRVARHERSFVAFRNLDLYERLIVEGSWWDLVDDAAHIIGAVLDADRTSLRPVLDEWIDDENLWLRRSAIISQLDLRERTDAEQLFGHCLRRAHEREFFIRKAIGWVLRQYARAEPEAVVAFCNAHRETLSPLSYREAMKHLRPSPIR